MIKRKVYTVYSDGACTKKGEGGAGAFIIDPDGVIKCAIKLRCSNTTNNQMELTGAILGLAMFKELAEGTNAKLILRTDSQYVQKGITQWIFNWIKKGWKSTSGDVLNKEIWQAIFKFSNEIKYSNRPVEYEWVRGHDGNAGNEVADHLASKTFSCDTQSMLMLENRVVEQYVDNDEISSFDIEDLIHIIVEDDLQTTIDSLIAI